ncbi:MAG: ribonuclease HI [Candidatus Paceibacterota bacterium]|jgi:ribonuclease HI
MKEKILIFSDGSSRGNPGPGGWGAIVADKNKITELGGRENHTTNNRMELMGAIKALSLIKKTKEAIVLNTDSAYVINGITKWVYGWQKNGWKNSTKDDVSNRDLWEELIKVSKGKNIKWNYVGGHIGVSCNERCDTIATSFADNEDVKLFKGILSDYEFDLNDTKGCSVKVTKKSGNKGIAYSYLSLVHGVLHIDKTWVECEKRVKGVKGDVKFKKATSPSEEKEILKEWLKQSTLR